MPDEPEPEPEPKFEPDLPLQLGKPAVAHEAPGAESVSFALEPQQAIQQDTPTPFSEFSSGYTPRDMQTPRSHSTGLYGFGDRRSTIMWKVRCRPAVTVSTAAPRQNRAHELHLAFWSQDEAPAQILDPAAPADAELKLANIIPFVSEPLPPQNGGRREFGREVPPPGCWCVGRPRGTVSTKARRPGL